MDESWLIATVRVGPVVDVHAFRLPNDGEAEPVDVADVPNERGIKVFRIETTREWPGDSTAPIATTSG